MKKIKIDIKNKRILEVLDSDPRISLSRLAKKVGVSIPVAEYRINKLLYQKTIYSFFTLIDPAKLGHELFRVHIKLKNIKEEDYKNFARELFEKYPTFWVAFVSGSFDIIADIWAKDTYDFSSLFKTILNKNKEFIQDYEINPILELNLYEYGYFLKPKLERSKTMLFKKGTMIELDEKDKRILKVLKANARIPYERIGSKVGLTRNAVKYRIQNLEKKGIIAGYKMMVDFTHFDRLTYKIFIKYNNSKIEQEDSLINFLENMPSILSTTKHLGKWNLDIEIEPKNVQELQKFLITLRNEFEIIENYEFIQIIEDYGLDFYPDTLV